MADVLRVNLKFLTGADNVSYKVEQLDSTKRKWKITLTGKVDGYFKDGLVGGYQELYTGDWVLNHPFTIEGNTATLIAETEYYNSVEVHGEFVVGAPTPTNLLRYDTTGLTGDVTITDKQGTDKHHFDITVTGNGDGTFSNLKAAYQDWDENYIEVYYSLTNCEIVGDKPVKVKTGQSYTFNFKANPNAELTEIQANFTNNIGDIELSNGTISEDKQTGTVTFNLTTGATDLTVYANADVVQSPTIKNYGAINVYIVTLENLDEFAKKRFFKPKGESDTGTTYSEVNLGQYVNRIKRIFTTVPVGGEDVLKCGNYNTEIEVKYPDSDVMLLDFGNVELTGANGNNEDFNAQVQMFIPCRGVVTIDSKYIGKTINLTIKVNVITGDAVALLACDGVTFQIESFSLSRDVLYRLGTDLNVVGGEQWNEQILYGLEPYVLITENLTVDVPVNNTQENVTINSVTGFAQFANVNLNTANLLVDEYSEIVSQLETGVYL